MEKYIKSINKNHVEPHDVDEAYNDILAILQTFRHFVSTHLQNKWPDLILEFLLADKVRAFNCCDPIRFLCTTTDGIAQSRLCGIRHPIPILVNNFLHI